MTINKDKSDFILDRINLLQTIRKSILNNKITNLYGISGIGKTTTCDLCLNKYFRDYNLMIIHEKCDIITVDWDSYCIHLLDDFDSKRLDSKTVNNIISSNDFSKFIFITRNELRNFDNACTIQIPPFSIEEIHDLIAKKLYFTQFYKSNILEENIIKISKGIPLYVNLIINYVANNNLFNIESLKTFYEPCIVDINGYLIDKANDSIKLAVSEVNDQLLYELSQNPKLLYNLSSYDFERVIARMFEKQGFSVEITPRTRDGGKDIFIAKQGLASFLFYVECKKYAPNKPVGIDVIQRLYGVISAEKANGGFIATTSYFTKPAEDYIKEYNLEHQLTLQDYNTISDILKSLQHKTQ